MRNYKPATFQPTVRPDWGGVLSYIPVEEKAKILEAIIKYPSVDIDSVFWQETIKPDLDLQYETFTQQCEMKSRAMRDRWGKTSCTSLQDNNKTSNKDVIVPEGIRIEEGIGIEEEKKNKIKNNIFKKPTLEEVRAYCGERQNNVDAERWINYYSSNGWKVGKNPMKDWKAAVRTWESKEKPKKTQETIFIDENMRIDEDMPEFKDMTFESCCKASEWLLQNMYCQTLAKDKFIEIVRKFK